MALIINDTSSRVTYTATSGQTEFTIPFEFFDETDIVVYVEGSLLSYNASPADNTEYSVTGAGSNGTKKITVGGAGVTLNDVVLIYRDVPLERLSDFATSGPFDIETLNTELDKIVALLQQANDGRNLSLRVPASDEVTSVATIPNSTTRATKVLAFDSNGDPTVSTETLTEIEGAATSATAAAASETAAAASETAAAASEAAAAASAAEAAAVLLKFAYSTTTSMADPGSGVVRLNNATLSSVTAAAFDALDGDGTDVSDLLAAMGSSSNTNKALLILKKVSAPQNFAAFYVTAVTDNTGWLQLTLTYITHAGSWSDTDDLAVVFALSGDAGSLSALAANLDGNGFNIIFDDGTGLLDDSSNEQLIFGKVASAVNYTKISNAATGNGPTVASEGETNVDLNVNGKGTGRVVLNRATVTENLRDTVYTISDGASVDIDPANGAIQFWTLGANRTAAASSMANGDSVTLRIADGSGFTLDLTTTMGVVWKDNSAPTLATSGYTEVHLEKSGGVIRGVHVGDFAS